MKATSRPTPISQRQLRCFGGAVGGDAAGGGVWYAGGAVAGGDEADAGTGGCGPAGGGPGGGGVGGAWWVICHYLRRGAGWGNTGHTRTDGSERVPTARRHPIAAITRQFPQDRPTVVRRAAKPDIAVCDTSGRHPPTLVVGGTQDEGWSFADAKSTRDARPAVGAHYDPGRTSGNAVTRGIHPVALTSSSDVCLHAGFDSCKSQHVSKSGCGPESELAVAAGRHRGRPRQVFDISRPQ
jgi:hypothetical protein